jgi:hypothetical protein
MKLIIELSVELTLILAVKWETNLDYVVIDYSALTAISWIHTVFYDRIKDDPIKEKMEESNGFKIEVKTLEELKPILKKLEFTKT